MLSGVLQHAADLISLHGPDGRYRSASPASRALLGVAPEALVGQRGDAHVLAEDAPKLAEAAEEARREGRATVCVRARRAARCCLAPSTRF